MDLFFIRKKKASKNSIFIFKLFISYKLKTSYHEKPLPACILLRSFSQHKNYCPKVPPAIDMQMHDIIENVSSERIEKDIRKLAAFGTRHTLSDTLSETRGIGAARRWIKFEFDKIPASCNNCLEVKFHKRLIKGGESPRIPEDTWIVNVMAVKRGTLYLQESLAYFGV